MCERGTYTKTFFKLIHNSEKGFHSEYLMEKLKIISPYYKQTLTQKNLVKGPQMTSW